MEKNVKLIADRSEVFSYMRKFTPQDLEDKKQELTDLAINLRQKQNQLRLLAKVAKKEIKTLQESIDEVLVDLQNKSHPVTETCYVVVDRDKLMSQYFSEDGEMVFERPATKDEMQMTIPFTQTAVNE